MLSGHHSQSAPGGPGLHPRMRPGRLSPVLTPPPPSTPGGVGRSRRRSLCAGRSRAGSYRAGRPSLPQRSVPLALDRDSNGGLGGCLHPRVTQDPTSALCSLQESRRLAGRSLWSPTTPHRTPFPGCSSQLCCLAAPLSHLAPGRPPLGDKVVTMARVHGALVTRRLLSHPGMQPPRALQTPAGHAEQLRPEHAGLRDGAAGSEPSRAASVTSLTRTLRTKRSAAGGGDGGPRHPPKCQSRHPRPPADPT